MNLSVQQQHRNLEGEPHVLARDVDELTDVTLRRIDEVVNQDVVMQPSAVKEIFHLVVDTNVLLHQLDALQQFVIDIEHHLPFTLQVIIPGIVISELDRQKTRNDKVAWAARLASTWLLEKVKERRFVKGQTHEETCKTSGKWNVKDVGESEVVGSSELNDDLILDCCLYFTRRPQHGGVVRHVALCSGDKNLCVKAESVGIGTLSPTSGWTSRAIVTTLFAGMPMVHLSNFDGQTSKIQRRTHRTDSNSTTKPGRTVALATSDAMEVDEEPIRPSHPLDVLHIEVVEHFSHLLLEVVDRVGGPEVPWYGPHGQVSRHAPSWAKIGFAEWTPRECVQYLGRKEGLRASQAELDKLANFLMYADKQGGRKGQDWTRSDWESCIVGLELIGRRWEDDELRESAEVLKRFARETFVLRMKPTGT